MSKHQEDAIDLNDTPNDSIDTYILGDIDAWNLRVRGDWYVFSANLPGGQGPRDFRRAISGGDIVAASPGPIYGILSIGGARRAGFADGPSLFPYHVVSPADDIGAVGLEGTDVAQSTDNLEKMRTRTRDVIIAETIIGQRQIAGRALPLMVTRTETDSSPSISALCQGKAYKNFVTAARNLKSASKAQGKRAVILAVGIDYILEDVVSDLKTFRDGFYSLMQKTTLDLGALGYRKPLFVSLFDSGTIMAGNNPLLMAQWELAVMPSDHDLIYAAPGYMFEQTVSARPTDDARQQMAEMEAYAIEAINDGYSWSCPMFLLAEKDDACIRVVAASETKLHVDLEDPLNAGKEAGFSLEGLENGAAIQKVIVDPKDEKSILIKFDKPPSGKQLQLCYAYGATNSPDRYPANRGSIRDSWTKASVTGSNLYRWALPCQLPVN